METEDDNVQPVAKHYVIGVVSFGRKCATKEVPGYYSNVAGSLEWIKGILDISKSHNDQRKASSVGAIPKTSPETKSSARMLHMSSGTALLMLLTFTIFIDHLAIFISSTLWCSSSFQASPYDSIIR